MDDDEVIIIIDEEEQAARELGDAFSHFMASDVEMPESLRAELLALAITMKAVTADAQKICAAIEALPR